MADPVTLTIDGRQIAVQPDTLIVEAAAQLGILVPVYCYHPKLKPVGACRMCLVEVEGAPKLIASCTTPVRDGMVVHTNNARVEKARKGMLEFLLIHHPLDCPVCDKGGECPLQDYTYEFGPTKSRFAYPKRHWEKPVQIGKNILLDRERCIMCFRCVRFCQEISDHVEIGVFNRGSQQEIGTVEGHQFDSQFSGNTIELCPVGALTGAPTRFFGRTWDTSHTPSVCTGCATGCNIRVDHRHGSEVVRLWSRENRHTDDGWLCDGGRFSYNYINENRLQDPKVKSEDTLVDATWQQASIRAASILSKAAQDGKLGILVSPKLTNEELYAASRIARTALKTNNIDHTVKPVNQPLADLYSVRTNAGFSAGVLRDIDEAVQIITIGVDLSLEQPVTELRVKKALFQRGASLVSLYDGQIELAQYAAFSPSYSGGQEASAISQLAKAVSDKSAGAGELLAQDKPKVVILGSSLSLVKDADALNSALAELAKAIGGAPAIVIVPAANTRGALDLGVSPGMLPGRESVTEPAARKAFSLDWGVDLPSEPGLSGSEMLKAAADGKLSALWVIGTECFDGADANLVRKALSNVQFVYQGWSVEGLPVSPDVVLASATYAEQDGTLTNTDGRVQRVFKSIRPHGRSRPGWQIIADVSRALGAGWEASSADQVFEEVRKSVPTMRDIKWGKLGAIGVQSASTAAVPEQEAVTG